MSVTAACGSHATNGGGDPGPATDGAAPGDDPGSVDGGGGTPFGSGSSGSTGGTFAGGADAGGTAQATDCQPGTYTGTFTTQVTNDAGILSIFSIAWSGMLTIVLQGQTTSTGGEIPTSTLTIAPGAMLDGTDEYGGHFSGALSGQLDCATRTLSGTLSNAAYSLPGTPADSGTLSLNGTLSGTYDDSTGTPALDGMLTIGSMQIDSTANGTWTASKQ